MALPNPYNYNLPATHNMFFGRQNEVEILARQLTAGLGDSKLLIGRRRMGKTSFLEALYQSLITEAKKSKHTLMPLPVLLDLSGGNIHSLESFFAVVCEQSKIAIEELLAEPTNIDCHYDTGRSPVQTFQQVLETWSQAVSGKCRRRLRLILLLDECEEVLDHPWSHSLQGALRSLLVGRKSRDFLKVVMAGSHRLISQTKLRGSPLWNVLSVHKLSVLNGVAVRELIKQPTKSRPSDEVVQAVISQTGGHAFLTQYVMSHLWERGIEFSTPAIVQEIATFFPEERSDFRDWINYLGDSGKIVYAMLTQSVDALQRSSIIRASGLTALDVADALDALCYHGLVVKKHNEEIYAIAGKMFQNWFVVYEQDRT